MNMLALREKFGDMKEIKEIIAEKSQSNLILNFVKELLYDDMTRLYVKNYRSVLW